MSKTITIVAPAYNESETIEKFHHVLSKEMEKLIDYAWNVVYVNDGSNDSTLEKLTALADQADNICIIDLTRNFGKEIAMTAGMDASTGDAVVVIDTDLQDPPALVAEFVSAWEQGADVAYGKRRVRHGESLLKRVTASGFYKLMSTLTRIEIPTNTGDFRLMTRPVVNSLLELREHHRFMKGLFCWVGYNQVAVEYDRDQRFAGNSKFTYWKLWNFALEGITSFSTVPLQIATYLGFFISSLAFIYGIWIVTKTLIWGEDIAGYPSLVVFVLVLGGLNLMFVGIIGEYLGRMFTETKRRPLYLVKEKHLSATKPRSNFQSKNRSA